MSTDFAWCKDTYERSLSSRCWWFTPYDDRWDGSGKHGVAVADDDELRRIVEMECELGPLPAWVNPVVCRAIRNVAPCGHYRFPDSFLQAVDAIGTGIVPPLMHTCFTVERGRKLRTIDYVLCLDAWLAGAAAEGVGWELAARGTGGVDWRVICRDLWHVLGEHTETKDLLVERLVHQWRWWLRSTMWDDDDGTVFCREAWVGEWREGACLLTDNGNPQVRGGGIDPQTSPRVQRSEARLAEICPDWPFFRDVICHWSWPCAPKAFRFLEKTLWCIGRGRQVISLPSRPLADPEAVPSFLQCGDTAADPRQASAWWRGFLAALRSWWRDEAAGGAVAADVFARLGERTPVKRWLVRLYVRRLEMLERHAGSLGRLVGRT